MSNKRITDLTELTNPTTDDVFPVVDIASNTTTKVQLGNLPVPTSVTTALATKQDTLVSGTNIKTVNSTSLVGSGNLAVQETLVSGTNIKTLNSTSLLGSGNIVLTANPSGVAGAIQFSNGSAFASDASNLFWDDTNNRLGVGLNNPSATTHIKGAGTGSGTNSFIVQDSAGTNLISVRDDGILSLFTSAKTGQLDIQGGVNSGIYSKAYSSQSDNIIRYKDYNGNQAMMLTMTGSGTGNLTVNNGITSLGATVGIKGSGSTSATTSLLVQNSSGASSLRVLDNGSVTNYGGTKSNNAAFGVNALVSNTSGDNNTAYGAFAMQANTSGNENTSVGYVSLINNSSGSQNVAMGYGALYRNNASGNTAIGYNALFDNTAANNTALGNGTVSGNFAGSVILGKDATATAANQFVVGSTGTNAGAIDSSAFTQDKRWKVKINGVDYYIALQTA
jgi:trimeric autotransporter adhesin